MKYLIIKNLILKSVKKPNHWLNDNIKKLKQYLADDDSIGIICMEWTNESDIDKELVKKIGEKLKVKIEVVLIKWHFMTVMQRLGLIHIGYNCLLHDITKEAEAEFDKYKFSEDTCFHMYALSADFQQMCFTVPEDHKYELIIPSEYDIWHTITTKISLQIRDRYFKTK